MMLLQILLWNTAQQEKLLFPVVCFMLIILVTLISLAFFSKNGEDAVVENKDVEVSAPEEQEEKISDDAVSIVDGDNDFIPRPHIKDLTETEEIQTDTKN